MWIWILFALTVQGAVAGNPDAKRLYDDLLSNYNKLVRPVVNTSDVLKVSIKLKLSQLIDVVRMLYRFMYHVVTYFHYICVHTILCVCLLIEFAEFEEPNYDHQSVGGTGNIPVDIVFGLRLDTMI